MNINQIVAKMYMCCYENGDILTISRYGVGYRPDDYGGFFKKILEDDYTILVEMRLWDFRLKTKNAY